MIKTYNAYLDIETTGLNPVSSYITVVGILLENDYEEHFYQLIGPEITAYNIMILLEKAHTLYTYNGSRFDLPFIKEKLGLDLEEYIYHQDLMYSCWKRGLYGGLKRIEQKLGITRKLKNIDGRMAVILWNYYIEYGDIYALSLLLEYNREDVINLKILKEKLLPLNL